MEYIKNAVPHQLVIQLLGIPKSTYYHYAKNGFPPYEKAIIRRIESEYNSFLNKAEKFKTELLDAV